MINTGRNLIDDAGSDVYTLVETALCIWEYVIEQTGRDDRGEYDESLYNWFTQHQGVYAGRAAAIDLAWLVEHAYQVGNGGELFALDGLAFDFEIVPFIIETWAKEIDQPSTITKLHAEAMGLRLASELGREE